MLTKRLEQLVSVVPQCDTLADVGCDHGYVGIEALVRGIAQRVIFVDVSAPSLDKARQNCPGELLQRADFVCCDGLGDIEADTAIIAGMGGLETISILSAAKHLPAKLVLQPMRNQRDVRQYLSQHYEIVTDVKFHDYKFYDLIVAEKCSHPVKLTEQELEFGKTNLESPSQDFKDYLQNEITKLKNIPVFYDNAELQQRARVLEEIWAQINKE